MHKFQISLVALILFFVIGSLRTAPIDRLQEKTTQSPLSRAESVAANTQEQAKELIDDPCSDHIEDNEFRTILNGQRLNLSYKARFESDFAQAKAVPLSTGQLLVGIGDTLYMCDEQRQIQWRHNVPQWLNDYAVVESTGLVYGTAGDNNMFILEAVTGRVLYRNSRNGRAAYGQVVPYGDDSCLITDNFSGYRHDWNELRAIPGMMNVATWKDGISCWLGTKELWHRDFPPDAEVLVKGRRIYAVTKTKTNIYVQELTLPAKAAK
jgi:hypothetical protein